MLSEQKVCKWITDKVEEGRGAVIFSLEENDGMVGVWVGDPKEHERALGYGDDVVSAVLDAIGKEAVEHRAQRTCAKSPDGEHHFSGMSYISCMYCGSASR